MKKYKGVECVKKYQNRFSKDIINEAEYQKLHKEEQQQYAVYEWAYEYSRYRLDSHGHLIVKHDLHNHDGLTRDGIAEAFAEFAKKEKLSFFA